MTDPIGTDYPVPFTADEFGVIFDADGDKVGEMLARIAPHAVDIINKERQPVQAKDVNGVRRAVTLEHLDGSRLHGIEIYYPVSFHSVIEVPSIGRTDPRDLWLNEGWAISDGVPLPRTVAEGMVDSAAAAWYALDYRVVDDFDFSRASFETRAAYTQRIKPALAAALRDLAAAHENVEVGVEGEDYIGYTSVELRELADDIERVDNA